MTADRPPQDGEADWGPCTECGAPSGCTEENYCCDECLHLDQRWGGYTTVPAAVAARPAGQEDWTPAFGAWDPDNPPASPEDVWEGQQNGAHQDDAANKSPAVGAADEPYIASPSSPVPDEVRRRLLNLTPVRRAALVLSDDELSDALDAWYAKRADQP